MGFSLTCHFSFLSPSQVVVVVPVGVFIYPLVSVTCSTAAFVSMFRTEFMCLLWFRTRDSHPVKTSMTGKNARASARLCI